MGTLSLTLASESGVTVDYGISVTTAAPFAETVQRVRDSLREQGFGVLTEIDVRATMHEKLGSEMEDYLILGACSPALADRALGTDRSIGLLLPCNVVVRTGPQATIVEAMNPQLMAEVTGQPSIQPVADEATARIRAALAAIGTAT